MASTVSTAVTAAASELLQQDAQPLLDELIAGINTVATNWAAKLPAAVSPEAALGVNLLTGLAAIAAHAELGVILRHNPAPGFPTPPAA